MLLSDFEFELPEGRIAAEPAEPRDAARLMVIDRSKNALEHRRFRDLPDYLRPGDCLVLNRTKVMAARLAGAKPTGGRVELLLLSPLPGGRWRALSREGRPGLDCALAGGEKAVFEERNEAGEWTVRLSMPDVSAYLERHGETPLPPYILKARPGKRVSSRDRERYQTVYAETPGSVAAPTAGLHFTPELLRTLAERGVRTARITLHIGWGTFRPVTAEKVEDHRMLPESYEVDAEAARVLSETRAAGGRIAAVGTSATRTLETLPSLSPSKGEAGLFIAPGHAFRHVDALVTNFHLPASTPLLLACAFAGRERLLAAYRSAIGEGYRFYSYGDACLIV